MIYVILYISHRCTPLNCEMYFSGCAFVTYANRQSAQNCIKNMHHSQTMEVCTQPPDQSQLYRAESGYMVNYLKFRTLVSNCSRVKMLIIKTFFPEMLIRISNREDPDQTAVWQSGLGFHCLIWPILYLRYCI